MIGQKHEVARFQSDLYRDNYHKMTRAFLINTVLIVVLIMAIIYEVIFLPPQHYYASTTTGQIIPLVALHQ